MSDIVELTKEQLRQLQLIDLEMMIEVDRICRKNGIKYSLSGGTLLGAIRHKGFIPWDDDADIMFTHEEYEKFYRACKSDLDTARFFLQDSRTDSGYRWGYGKLRRRNTEYIKRGQEHLEQKTGVCIDLFEYQYLPDNLLARKIYQAKMFCLRKVMYSSLGKFAEKNFALRLWYRLLELIPIRVVHDIRLHDLDRANDLNSNKMSCEMFPDPAKKDGIDSNIFKKYVDVEFEGMSFMATREYDKYLTVSYGNYMQLPPEEKRKGVMNAVQYKLIPVEYSDLYRRYKEKSK